MTCAQSAGSSSSVVLVDADDGVTYKIVPNKNPEDWSFESRYICVSGCKRHDAPPVMIMRYWECGEL
jgi:hypothetical protein